MVSAQLGANYNIIVSQNGNAFVLATFSGEGEVRVPLPPDAGTPYVKGAIYMKSGNYIILAVTGDRMATVSYRSDEMTHKTGKSWSFSLALPENITNTYVSVSLPKSASISSVTPGDGIIMSEEDSAVVAWSSASGFSEATVAYELQAETGGTNGENGGVAGTGFSFDFWMFAVVGTAVLIALIAIVAFLYYRTKAGPGKSLAVTEGMRNVMKAMNENDVKVVEEIIKAGGEMKRSELERRTEIAKSSLALSLDRLEKNGTIKINKETTTHRIALTEWFRSL